MAVFGMSPGKAAAYGQGAVAGDEDPDPSAGFSSGEAPEGKPEQSIVQKTVNVVKGLFGTAGQKSKQQYGIKGSGTPSSQNFFQKNENIQALLDKGYTISKSGNTLYSPYDKNNIAFSARDRAENMGVVPDEIAFRTSVAGIDPVTGMMFSGGTKGGLLDKATSTMITPSRAKQNISRTAKYKAQSDAALGGLLTPEQREANKKSSFLGFDLDGDGNPFTSTRSDGVVFGMSNKAIYDPNIQSSAYRGIPESYETGSVTQNPTTGALGTYGGQEESDDRMLFNEAMSYVMPGAGIVRGVNFLKDYLNPEPEVNQTRTGMSDDQFNNFLGSLGSLTSSGSSVVPSARLYGSDFLSLSEAEKNKFMSRTNPYKNKVTTIPLDNLVTSSNFENFTGEDLYGNPMYSDNPIVGYKNDGTTAVYANDTDASQYQNPYGGGMQ